MEKLEELKELAEFEVLEELEVGIAGGAPLGAPNMKGNDDGWLISVDSVSLKYPVPSEFLIHLINNIQILHY